MLQFYIDFKIQKIILDTCLNFFLNEQKEEKSTVKKIL